MSPAMDRRRGAWYVNSQAAVSLAAGLAVLPASLGALEGQETFGAYAALVGTIALFAVMLAAAFVGFRRAGDATGRVIVAVTTVVLAPFDVVLILLVYSVASGNYRG